MNDMESRPGPRRDTVCATQIAPPLNSIRLSSLQLRSGVLASQSVSANESSRGRLWCISVARSMPVDSGVAYARTQPEDVGTLRERAALRHLEALGSCVEEMYTELVFAKRLCAKSGEMIGAVSVGPAAVRGGGVGPGE